jgi:hypothetical protein
MSADSQYEAAYNAGVASGLRKIQVTRTCQAKYPEPVCWGKYNDATYAYFVESSKTVTTKKGLCETTWCEYVDWVIKHKGQTYSNETVSDSWFNHWYAWDLMKKYPAICATYSSLSCNDGSEYSSTSVKYDKGTTNLWYWCENCGNHRDYCITYKSAYCTDLGTFCEGMTDEFRAAWGANSNGGYDPKIVDGKSMTIYEAWCTMSKNSTYLSDWTNLQTYTANAASYASYFDEKIKSSMDKYWNDDWTDDSGTNLTTSNKTTATTCYRCDLNTGASIASKIYETENSYSNMPWYWRYGLNRSTNDWYKFILFSEYKSKCQDFHKVDQYLKACKQDYEAVMGAGTSTIQVRDMVRDDYNDFTAPAWWGKWCLVGQQTSVNANPHPTTGTTAPTCDTYARYLWVWKLPDKTSETLMNMLWWFINDYTGTDNYGIGHHGNTWAQIWLQYATRKCSGSFTGNQNAGWDASTILCGSNDTKASNANKGGLTQMLATFPNTYNAFKYYDKVVTSLYWYYHGDATVSFGNNDVGLWDNTNSGVYTR